MRVGVEDFCKSLLARPQFIFGALMLDCYAGNTSSDFGESCLSAGRTLGFPVIHGKRAEHFTGAGKYWRGPAGAHTRHQSGFAIIFPERILKDVRHDHLL